MSEVTSRTPEKRAFYRVEEVILPAGNCTCPNCQQWTIVFEDAGEPTEIGNFWQGDDGKEQAEDICDLMNDAYDLGYDHGFMGVRT